MEVWVFTCTRAWRYRAGHMMEMEKVKMELEKVKMERRMKRRREAHVPVHVAMLGQLGEDAWAT